MWRVHSYTVFFVDCQSTSELAILLPITTKAYSQLLVKNEVIYNINRNLKFNPWFFLVNICITRKTACTVSNEVCSISMYSLHGHCVEKVIEFPQYAIVSTNRLASGHLRFAISRGGSRKIFDRIKSAVELCNVRDPSAERASPPWGPKKF